MKCFQLLLISSSCLFFERFTWVSQFSLTLLLLVIWTLNYKCTRCLLKMTPISKQFSAINFPLKIYNFRTISLVAIPLPGTKNNLTEWNKTKHNATSTHCGPIIFWSACFSVTMSWCPFPPRPLRREYTLFELFLLWPAQLN